MTSRFYNFYLIFHNNIRANEKSSPVAIAWVLCAMAMTIMSVDVWTTAQWAKSGFFVQWVYWVYLFSQNTRPLCNAAMYEQV